MPIANTTVGVDLFILGAGFSRGIHDSMPLTRDLWSLLQKWLDNAGLAVTAAEQEQFDALGHDLEQWLSYIAQEQPFLGEVDKYRNRARFLEVAESLAAGMSSIQQNVLDEGDPPEWLVEVQRAWHKREATIITLNYDTLVEAAYWAATSREFIGLYQAPIAHLNARSASVYGGADYDEPTFRLLKLHGSVNWFQPTQGPLAYYMTPGDKGRSWDWRPFDLDYQAIASRGLRRALVPPVMSKDPFLATDLFTIQWQVALQSIRSANQIWVLGYSLPAGDHTMQFLLSNAPSGTTINVASGSAVADEVAQRFPTLHVLGIGSDARNRAEAAARQYVSTFAK